MTMFSQIEKYKYSVQTTAHLTNPQKYFCNYYLWLGVHRKKENISFLINRTETTDRIETEQKKTDGIFTERSHQVDNCVGM